MEPVENNQISEDAEIQAWENEGGALVLDVRNIQQEKPISEPSRTPKTVSAEANGADGRDTNGEHPVVGIKENNVSTHVGFIAQQ